MKRDRAQSHIRYVLHRIVYLTGINVMTTAGSTNFLEQNDFFPIAKLISYYEYSNVFPHLIFIMNAIFRRKFCHMTHQIQMTGQEKRTFVVLNSQNCIVLLLCDYLAKSNGANNQQHRNDSDDLMNHIHCDIKSTQLAKGFMHDRRVHLSIYTCIVCGWYLPIFTVN